MSTRKPKQTMTAEPEKWTWQEAEEALKKNATNRNLRRTRVDAYARLMNEKKWGTPTGTRGVKACLAPVVFDWDGNLIDAQHRLYAQVQSKTAQYWYVIRDADPAAQLILDANLTRSAADALKFAGYGNYTKLSSVARWCWLLEQGEASNGKITVINDEIVDMVDRHPDLTHSTDVASWACTSVGVYKPLLRSTYLGAAHWWIAQFNSHLEADLFIGRFVHPQKEVDGSAVIALMSRFASAANNNETLPTRIQIAMTLKAWNLDVEGKYVQKLPARNRSGEFPIPTVAIRNVSQEIRFGPYTDAEIESGEYAQVAS